MKIGDYVRTKDKILKIDSFERDKRNIDCVCFSTGEIYTLELLNEIMTKHSKNIIDLIQLGDYVNGEKVINIYNPMFLGFGELPYIVTKTNHYEEQEIKTILTHEQYEANCYKLEE